MLHQHRDAGRLVVDEGRNAGAVHGDDGRALCHYLVDEGVFVRDRGMDYAVDAAFAQHVQKAGFAFHHVVGVDDDRGIAQSLKHAFHAAQDGRKDCLVMLGMGDDSA